MPTNPPHALSSLPRTDAARGPEPPPAAVPGTLAAWDRCLRLALGGPLLWLGWILVDGPAAAVIGSVGAIVSVTALAGVCPVYLLFGLDSRRLGR